MNDDRITYDQLSQLIDGRDRPAAHAIDNAARGVNATERTIREITAMIRAKLTEIEQRLDHGLSLNELGELQRMPADLDRAITLRQAHWQVLGALLTETEMTSLQPAAPSRRTGTPRAGTGPGGRSAHRPAAQCLEVTLQACRDLPIAADRHQVHAVEGSAVPDGPGSAARRVHPGAAVTLNGLDQLAGDMGCRGSRTPGCWPCPHWPAPSPPRTRAPAGRPPATAAGHRPRN